MPELNQFIPTTANPVNPAIITATIDATDSRLFARAVEEAEHTALGRCEWEEPESSYGACDGGHQCYETATVFNLADEAEYCPSHHAARSQAQLWEIERASLPPRFATATSKEL